jgi:hypothetical protein
MKRLLFGHLLILSSFLAHAGTEILRPIDQGVEELTRSSCIQSAQELERKLRAFDKHDYQDELLVHGKDVLDDLWSIKLKLHQKLKDFNFAIPVECARSIRGVFTAIRLVEDTVEEHYVRTNGLQAPSSAFAPNNEFVRRAKGFENFRIPEDLQSGDVILSRGNAYTSAAIASLGEADTQFSHVSFVYKDENGKLWTTEAHIEVGSIVRPIEEHIKDNNFRTMILRYEDQALAAQASQYAFKRVQHASRTTGNIPYDFGFDMGESKSLFCSEVVSWSIEMVSGRMIQVPFYKNRVLLRKPKFVNDLGITVEESFIPADLEIDPRFTIVVEWRDANRINDSLEKDALIQAMFTWADEHNYRLINASSFKSLLYRNVIWPIRRTPLLKNFVDEKLPLNMSRTLVGYFGTLESVGELLQKTLKAEDEKSRNERGFPLLANEKFEVLENFRQEDLKLKKPKLHKMYRPVTSSGKGQ